VRPSRTFANRSPIPGSRRQMKTPIRNAANRFAKPMRTHERLIHSGDFAKRNGSSWNAVRFRWVVCSVRQIVRESPLRLQPAASECIRERHAHLRH
jgi:hypothetical protein